LLLQRLAHRWCLCTTLDCADNPWEWDDNGVPRSYRPFVLQFLRPLLYLDGTAVTPEERQASMAALQALPPEECQRMVTAMTWERVRPLAVDHPVVLALKEAQSRKAAHGYVRGPRTHTFE
jgi:hypothetical protein